MSRVSGTLEKHHLLQKSVMLMEGGPSIELIACRAGLQGWCWGPGGTAPD
jgi:hypothetical protein